MLSILLLVQFNKGWALFKPSLEKEAVNWLWGNHCTARARHEGNNSEIKITKKVCKLQGVGAPAGISIGSSLISLIVPSAELCLYEEPGFIWNLEFQVIYFLIYLFGVILEFWSLDATEIQQQALRDLGMSPGGVGETEGRTNPALSSHPSNPHKKQQNSSQGWIHHLSLWPIKYFAV